MKNYRTALFGATCMAIVLALPTASARQKDEKDKKQPDVRPKLTLKAQPILAIAPARIVFTAELIGGANDYQEFYCPTVQWEWGDDTTSEATADCEPYEPGKSEIKRRFAMDHTFQHGNNAPLKVSIRLKHRDKILALATTNIQIRPGIRDIGN